MLVLVYIKIRTFHYKDKIWKDKHRFHHGFKLFNTYSFFLLMRRNLIQLVIAQPLKYKSWSQIAFMFAEYMPSNRSLIWTYVKVTVGTFQTSCNETFSFAKENYVEYEKLSLASLPPIIRMESPPFSGESLALKELVSSIWLANLQCEWTWWICVYLCWNRAWLLCGCKLLQRVDKRGTFQSW